MATVKATVAMTRRRLHMDLPTHALDAIGETIAAEDTGRGGRQHARPHHRHGHTCAAVSRPKVDPGPDRWPCRSHQMPRYINMFLTRVFRRLGSVGDANAPLQCVFSGPAPVRRKKWADAQSLGNGQSPRGVSTNYAFVAGHHAHVIYDRWPPGKVSSVWRIVDPVARSGSAHKPITPPGFDGERRTDLSPRTSVAGTASWAPMASPAQLHIPDHARVIQGEIPSSRAHAVRG